MSDFFLLANVSLPIFVMLLFFSVTSCVVVLSRVTFQQGDFSKVFPFVICFEFWSDMTSTDIRVIFLYECKLSNTVVKAACNMHQEFGNNTVNDRKGQHWFEKYRFFITTVKNNDLKALVGANPIVPTRELANRMESDLTTIL